MANRKGYRFGVEWIALNDEPEEFDVDDIAANISTSLLADLFGNTPEQVALDVRRARIRKTRQANE